MAHLVSSMAYTGQAPWHELGNYLPAQQPIEVWAKAAGMDWQIESSPVQFGAAMDEHGKQDLILPFDEHKVLYRSDNKQPLSVVSQRYQIVQPQEVLAFYRDLTEQAGYELETAGVLKEGRKFWALARTGKETVIKGNDLVKGYLLLATSCDGTLATTATHTTVRVVCNNTLAVALNGESGAVKVPHSTVFNAQEVKRKLGIAVSQWDSFMYQMKMLSERKVKSHEAMHYFMRVLCKTAGIHGAKLWADGVPEYVQVQVMHQLAVTGKRAADVAVLIGGQELRVYRIERDEQMIANLIELERQFWHYVETDTAPPADGSDSAETALRCLFPHDNGESVDFSHDADLNHVFEDLLAIRQTLKANEAQESLLRQRIEQEMGNASKAQFQSGTVTWKRSKDSLVLDTAKLNAEQPALVAQYQTQRAGSRRFVLSGKVS